MHVRNLYNGGGGGDPLVQTVIIGVASHMSGTVTTPKILIPAR